MTQKIPFETATASYVSPGVLVDGGGFIVIGGKIIPVPPWNPEGKLGLTLRDIYVGLATVHLASIVSQEAGKELHNAAVKLVTSSIQEL